VKGFIHSKDERGYTKDAYITIVKNLLSVNSRLLDVKNKVSLRTFNDCRRFDMTFFGFQKQQTALEVLLECGESREVG
jgi:hypothetical protein